MPRRPRRSLVPALVVAAALVSGGCGGDDATTDGGESSEQATPGIGPHGPVVGTGSTGTTAAPPASDTLAAGSSSVIRFEAPAEVSCTGTTADVQVVYVTTGLDAVGFAIDGTGVQSTPPSTSGQHTLSIPCDDRVHTIVLVGSGPSGPAFATRAVAARPA